MECAAQLVVVNRNAALNSGMHVTARRVYAEIKQLHVCTAD